MLKIKTLAIIIAATLFFSANAMLAEASIAAGSTCAGPTECAANCAGGTYKKMEATYTSGDFGIVELSPEYYLCTGAAATKFQYTLLEAFPGFFSAGASPDLPAMILAIYKFGIWTVGIAGLFMLVIGGFTYMASAGNNAALTNAKKIIWDSLLGIVAAMGAYLVMYVINPDLTKINISFTTASTEVTEGTPMGPAGECKQLSSGYCSVAELTSFNKTNIPDVWAKQASSICNGESRGNENALSSVDRCKGGGTDDPVSAGLFQINLSVHKMPGLDCPSAFNTKYTAKIAKDKTQCWVTDRTLYNQCIAAARVPAKNLAVAWNIYVAAGNSWKPWGANKNSGCNYP